VGKILLWVLVIIVALFVMRVVASRAAARNAVPPPKAEEKTRSRWGFRGQAGSQQGASNDSNASANNHRGTGQGNLRPPAGRAPDPTLGAAEPMVRCAHCGIHLPRSEALMKGGQTWCSDAHAQLGVRQT